MKIRDAARTTAVMLFVDVEVHHIRVPFETDQQRPSFVEASSMEGREPDGRKLRRGFAVDPSRTVRAGRRDRRSDRDAEGREVERSGSLWRLIVVVVNDSVSYTHLTLPTIYSV